MATVSAASSPSPSSYFCPDSSCGQTFADLDAFHKHWTRHKEQCPFPSCETSIDSKYNFGRHCARKHSDHFVEYQYAGKTACKYLCGKSYSKANVSNRKRHEKTCRRDQTRRQSQERTIKLKLLGHGNPTSTTDQGLHYTSTSQALLDPDISSGSDTSQHSPSWNGLLESHDIHGRTLPIRRVGCWRDSRPLVKAIETLHRFLANGPAADALEAFTRSLDDLGPLIGTSPLHSSDTSNAVRESFLDGHSDDSIELKTSRSSSYESIPIEDLCPTNQPDYESVITCLPVTSRCTIDTEDADFSYLSPKRHRLVEMHETNLTSTTQEKEEEEEDGDGDEDEDGEEGGDEYVGFSGDSYLHIVEAAAESVHLLWLDTYLLPEETDNPSIISDLQSQISDVLLYYRLQSLCPKVTSLALWFVYRILQERGELDSKLGNQHLRIRFALVLAKRIYESKLRMNPFWAKVIELPWIR